MNHFIFKGQCELTIISSVIIKRHILVLIICNREHYKLMQNTVLILSSYFITIQLYFLNQKQCVMLIIYIFSFYCCIIAPCWGIHLSISCVLLLKCPDGDYVLWFELGRPHLSFSVVCPVIRETRNKENSSIFQLLFICFESPPVNDVLAQLLR